MLFILIKKDQQVFPGEWDSFAFLAAYCMLGCQDTLKENELFDLLKQGTVFAQNIKYMWWQLIKYLVYARSHNFIQCPFFQCRLRWSLYFHQWGADGVLRDPCGQPVDQALGAAPRVIITVRGAQTHRPTLLSKTTVTSQVSKSWSGAFNPGRKWA